MCVCFSLGIFVYFFLHTDYQTPAGLLQITPGLLDAHLLLLSFSNVRVLRELHRPSGISPTQLSTRKAACEASRGPKAAAAPLFVLFGLRLTCLDRVEKKTCIEMNHFKIHAFGSCFYFFKFGCRWAQMRLCTLKGPWAHSPSYKRENASADQNKSFLVSRLTILDFQLKNPNFLQLKLLKYFTEMQWKIMCKKITLTPMVNMSVQLLYPASSVSRLCRHLL